MVDISICGECKGKGKYPVYNAYDSSFEELVICEYCDGKGTLDEFIEGSSRKRHNEGERWVN